MSKNNARALFCVVQCHCNRNSSRFFVECSNLDNPHCQNPSHSFRSSFETALIWVCDLANTPHTFDHHKHKITVQRAKHFGCQLKLKHTLVHYQERKKTNDGFHLASLSPNKYQIVSLRCSSNRNQHTFYNSRFDHI